MKDGKDNPILRRQKVERAYAQYRGIAIGIPPVPQIINLEATGLYASTVIVFYFPPLESTLY